MHDYNLFADIKKLLTETKLAESHTTEEIKTLSTSELKKLHKEYSEKDTDEAKKEAAEIKKEIESRSEEKDETIDEQVEELHEIEGRRRPYKRPTTTEFLARLKKQKEEAKKKEEKGETKSEKKLDEEDNRASPIWNTHKPVQNWNRVADYYSIVAKREAARRAEVEKEIAARQAAADAARAKKNTTKTNVAEQNEELLAILDTLCEMLNVDMMTLVEETRKEMENLGRAYSWDKPSPEGAEARNERIARVKANMARLGKRRDRDAIKTGEMTAHQIEMSGDDLVHEPTAKQRAKGAPATRRDIAGYDRMQDSIEKISDKFTMKRVADQKNEMIKRLQPFALGGIKPKKGKGKK